MIFDKIDHSIRRLVIVFVSVFILRIRYVRNRFLCMSLVFLDFVLYSLVFYPLDIAAQFKYVC